MSNNGLLERAQAFIDDHPQTPFNPSSRDFLRQDPMGWSTSKNRELRAALLEGDMEAVELIKDDVAHVVGLKFTELWYLNVMEKIVAKSYEADEETPDDSDLDETVP